MNATSKRPIITTDSDVSHDFHDCGDESKKARLFAVVPGVNAADALTTAICLLESCEQPVFDAGMGGDFPAGTAWLVHHALQSARAVLASVQWAVEEFNDRSPEPGPAGAALAVVNS